MNVFKTKIGIMAMRIAATKNRVRTMSFFCDGPSGICIQEDDACDAVFGKNSSEIVNLEIEIHVTKVDFESAAKEIVDKKSSELSLPKRQ